MNTNIENNTRMLIVLAAPTVDNAYYQDVYQKIIKFDITYAKAIMGNDNVVILGDKQTLDILGRQLPADILLEASMPDIWMRDFTTINPHHPIQFRYTAAGQNGRQEKADSVQKGFIQFTKQLGIAYSQTKLILDGGNVVDNYKDKAIVTDRFLLDNQLTKAQAKVELKALLHVENVAIIPSDDTEGLGHADGMVMFADENSLIVNRYDEPFRSDVLRELGSSFADINIVEIDVNYDEEVWDAYYASACGLNINSLVTNDFIYMPVYDTPLDKQVVATVKSNTSKTVIPIDADKVCVMGGAVRCLGWQQTGKNAAKLMQAARQ